MSARSLGTFFYLALIYFTTQPLVLQAHGSKSDVSWETVNAMKEVVQYLHENPILTGKLLALLRTLSESPTESPSPEPTTEPTDRPSHSPTAEPTTLPTYNPTHPSQCYLGQICVNTEDCCPEGLDPSDLGITCSRVSHPNDEDLVENCCIKHDHIGCILDDDCCGAKSICHEEECWGKHRQEDEGIIA